MESVSIYLSPEHREYAENLAQDTFEKYQNVKGHYRNLLSSHLIGRYGEMGAYQFFINRRIQAYPYFSNIEYDPLCDINTKLGRCEVKTWNPDLGGLGSSDFSWADALPGKESGLHFVVYSVRGKQSHQS